MFKNFLFCLKRLSLLLALSLQVFYMPAANADIIKQGVLCADDQSICINGILSVDDARGLALLKGRVKSTTRPGYLRITLHGYESNQVRTAYIQGRLQGKYFEVVDLKNSASHSSDAKWKVIKVEYLKLD